MIASAQKVAEYVPFRGYRGVVATERLGDGVGGLAIGRDWDLDLQVPLTDIFRFVCMKTTLFHWSRTIFRDIAHSR